MFKDEISITFNQLHQYIKENNIPEDVKLLSDSGWECNATGIRAAYYNRENNVLFLYQDKDPDFCASEDIEDKQRREATQLLSDDFYYKDNYYFKDR